MPRRGGIYTGGFFLANGSHVDNVDAEEIMPASLMVLQQCLGAYRDGLPSVDTVESATQDHNRE